MTRVALVGALMTVVGCASDRRGALLMDPADYPLEFEGAFLTGAAGVGILEIEADGTASLELRAYRWHHRGEEIDGPEGNWLIRGVLALDPVESQDGNVRYVVRQPEETHLVPTLITYMRRCEYTPVTGSVSLSPDGQLEARLKGARRGVLEEEDLQNYWVHPPEALDEVIRGPATVLCAEGVTHPGCFVAAP